MLTGFVSIDPEEKNHTFSWVLVLRLSYSRQLRVARSTTIVRFAGLNVGVEYIKSGLHGCCV